MDYFVIEVPDMNDSVVKVSLQSRLYQLRFTWNDTGGYWMLGVMVARNAHAARCQDGSAVSAQPAVRPG